MEGTWVSAESNAQFIAFRRFVYRLSQQLNQQEKQVLIYIRLYKYKDQYKDATVLEIFSKLETDGLFSSSNPEGLVEIARDIQRQDLVGEVKEFIKRRNKKASLASNKHFKSIGNDWITEEDLQLKATFEVALAQATVLMQQIERLEHALAGGKHRRQKAEQAIREAGQTATALAERLKRAQVDLGMNVSQQRDHTPDRFSPLGRPIPRGNVNAQSRASALPQPVPRHAPPKLMNRHSLPVMYPSPLRSPNHNFDPTFDHKPLRSKLSSSVSQEVLKEEDEEDDYEKMYPAQLSALHLGSSLNAQSSFNEPSNTSSAKSLTSPASMSAYSHSTRTYDPQDCINRQTSNGMNAYNDTSSSGVQKGSIETHQVHVLNRLRGTESSGQEASISNRAETNAQKSELENRVAGVPSKRDASSDSFVKPSRRKAPVAPPRRQSHAPIQQSSSYGYVDCAHHTRVPVPILNDSTTDRDDVYTTLRPLGDSTAARDTSDSGLEELQQLRKFITTDPVLKESRSAHYYKHLQRDENAEDNPYTALNYDRQDP